MNQFLISFEYDTQTNTDEGASLSVFDGICARVSYQSTLNNNH
jgi:hypothetical protein